MPPSLMMPLPDAVKPLPDYLARRYGDWHASCYRENESRYQSLADKGQHPRAMVISCCDSRVNAMSLFGGEDGDFFIHRNIANLIPPFDPEGDHHGTSAAVEFAVTVLKVDHLLLLGHSGCGGVRAGFHAFGGAHEEPLAGSHFIGKWLELLRPAYEGCNATGSEAERIHALEQRSIVHSLKNLMDFPFVLDAVTQGRLSLHGLWHDIGSGRLYGYDAPADRFVPVI